MEVRNENNQLAENEFIESQQENNGENTLSSLNDTERSLENEDSALK